MGSKGGGVRGGEGGEKGREGKEWEGIVPPQNSCQVYAPGSRPSDRNVWLDFGTDPDLDIDLDY